jgi:Opioid growth factor receptor (OGFr) conserved region
VWRIMRSKIIDFYLGKYRHPGSGLTIDEMWKWDDNHLSGMHGYITWWFPTRKEAAAIDWDPITDEEIKEFKTNPELRKRVLTSFYRIIRFYGLEVDKLAKPPALRKAENYEDQKKVWITEENHNFKRISRILQSLVLLGFMEAAEIFLAALVEIYFQNRKIIGLKTYEIWTLSVSDPRYWNGLQ